MTEQMTEFYTGFMQHPFFWTCVLLNAPIILAATAFGGAFHD